MSAVVTIVGNITKDAQTREAGGGKVTSFGIASNDKVKGEKVTRFFDVSYWGGRGEAIAQYLTKGKNVTVIGKFSTREYEGKTYLQCEAYEVAFGGGGGAGASNGERAAESTDSKQTDDIPF